MGKRGAQIRDKRQKPKTLRRLPRVYNIGNGDAPLSARYCGRGTPWGNPFVINGWWPAKQRRMTRDDVCDRFRDETLPKLDVSELRGVDLECHCAPLRCHCNDIIRKANPGYEEKIKELEAARQAARKAERESREAFEARSNEARKVNWTARNARRSEERAKSREEKA